MSIWKVHIDAIREQDMNARVMQTYKFDRLVENIKKDKRLESLPLTWRKPDSDEGEVFRLISGHHRVRAARAAGLQEIFVMNIDEDLSRSTEISKQLAHNALQGEDNPDILLTLYQEIDDINERIMSGLTEVEIGKMEMPNVPADDLEFDFGFEDIHILFLKKDFEQFEKVIDVLEGASKIYLADLDDFERMKKEIVKVSKNNNVRNIAAIMKIMLDILEKYNDNKTTS